MKKLLLVFILMQTLNLQSKSQSIYSGRKEIANFKEGIFRYEESPYNNTKVTRTKNYQEEDHQSTKVKVRFKIDWVSDFEYHLTFDKVSDKTGNCLIGKVIKVKILEANENSWKIYTEFEGKFSTFTMTKTASLPKKRLLSFEKDN
jgi:hypothetical protein